MVDQISSIGSNVARDYATVALWEASLPASIAGTGNNHVGEVYNDSELVSATTTMFDGVTQDNSARVILRAASGEGISDNFTASTALTYDGTTSASIRGTGNYSSTFEFRVPIILENLQIQGQNNLGISYRIESSVDDFQITGCIVRSRSVILNNNGGNDTPLVAVNCVFQKDNANVASRMVDIRSGFSFNHCSFVQRDDGTSSVNSVLEDRYSNSSTYNNCAFFSDYNDNLYSGPASEVSGNNNGMNNTAAQNSIGGANDVTDLARADQFENVTTTGTDWRIKTGSSLIGAGAPSSVTTDITGRTRSTTTPTIGAWEFISAGAALLRIVDENLGLTEATQSNRGILRTVSDNLGLTEALISARGIIRTVSDNIGLTEALITTRGIIRTVSDNIGLTEAVINVRGIMRIVSDNLGITEAIQRVKGLTRIVNENVGLTEAVQRLQGLTRIVNENLGLSEAVLRTRSLIRTVNESLGIAENLVKLQSVLRIFSDNIGLTENTLRFRGMLRIVNEAMGISESIIRTAVASIESLMSFVGTRSIAKAWTASRDLAKSLTGSKE